MKLAITFLIVAAVAVAGAWYFVINSDMTPSLPDETTPPATTTPEENGTTDPDEGIGDADTVPAGWQTFESEVEAGYTFSVRRPSETNMNQVQPTIYELKYIGPDAEPNTEITDGYYLSFVLDGDATLETYGGRADASGSVRETTLNGYPAITYETTSALTGQPVAHTVLAPRGADSPVLDVSAQVFGDTDGGYQDTVDLILSTIEFNESSDGGSAETDDRINVTDPTPGETVSSPITVSGEARGTWFFEATAPVVVVDWDGRILGEGYIEAEGDWMTEDFVPFSGSISYEQETDPVSASGTVIFQKSNPSGLPQNDAAVEVPVMLE